MLALDGNQWLEGFQRLDRALEADRSGVDVVSGCGLGHYRTDEIVGQDSASRFPCAQVPASYTATHPFASFLLLISDQAPRSSGHTIDVCQITGADFFCVQQRGDNDDCSTPKARLLNSHKRFPDHEELGKRIVGRPINRTGLRSA